MNLPNFGTKTYWVARKITITMNVKLRSEDKRLSKCSEIVSSCENRHSIIGYLYYSYVYYSSKSPT